jgi:hypothetical protein
MSQFRSSFAGPWPGSRGCSIVGAASQERGIQLERPPGLWARDISEGETPNGFAKFSER